MGTKYRFREKKAGKIINSSKSVVVVVVGCKETLFKRPHLVWHAGHLWHRERKLI